MGAQEKEKKDQHGQVRVGIGGRETQEAKWAEVCGLGWRRERGVHVRPRKGLRTAGLPLKWGLGKEGKFREILRPMWNPIGGRTLGDIQGEVSRSSWDPKI